MDEEGSYEHGFYRSLNAPYEAPKGLVQMHQRKQFETVFHLPRVTIIMTTPLVRAAIASSALAAAFACSDPSGPGTDPSPQPTVFTIDSTTALVAGEPATIRGTNLELVESLLVEGQNVTFTLSGPTQINFAVPSLRDCETDGRPVAVVAGGAGKTAQHSARVKVTDVVDMDVGESRLLAEGDLHCMQFAAADEDYVLSTLNTVRDTSSSMRDMLSFRTWTEGSAAPASLALAFAAPQMTVSSHEHTRALNSELPPPTPFTGAPTLFDPNYTTAQVGDTLQFARWGHIMQYSHLDQASLPEEAIRTTVVAAVEGSTVVVVDLASVNAAEQLTDFGREWLATAARLADPLLVPSVKQLYGDAFEPLAGANGRYFVIVADNVGAGSIDGGTWGSEAWHRFASETMTSQLGSQIVNRTPEMARNAASTMIHEYGHLAAMIARGHHPVFNGWMEESFATTTEGVAYRIATGQPSKAVLNDATAPATFSGMQAAWGRLPNHSPFSGVGTYTRGAVIVQYARELYGDAATGSTGPTLYQAYHDAPGTLPSFFDASGILDRLASLVGLSGIDLLDQAMLADATDDLIDPAAASAAALPQIATWYRPDARAAASNRALSRTTAQAVTLAAAPGSYAAAYLIADSGKRGISISHTHHNGSDAIIRLTRVK